MAIDKSFIKGALGSIGERVTHVKEMVGNSFDSNFLKGKNKDKPTGCIEEIEANYYKKSKIAATMYEIENILSLKMSDPFTVKFKQCFEQWRLCEYSLARVKSLNYIRKAYYSEGKIFDIIGEINELISLLDEPENADVVKAVAYTNYISNLKIYIEEMKTENLNSDALQEYNMTPDSKVIEAFIKSECSEIQPIMSLYEAYKIGSELKEKSKEILDDPSVEKYGQLSCLMEEFKSGSKKVDGLDNLIEYFNKKRASNEATIEKIENLYKKLVEVFTNEWFEAFDYKNEESAVNKVQAEELKEFYINHMTKVNEIIEEYKKD